jgi:glycolate oxidase FAD binding subunit
MAGSGLVSSIVHQPSSLAELSEIVRESEALRIIGLNTWELDRLPAAGTPILDVGRLQGILEVKPFDLTVSLLAGTPIIELQAGLAEHNLCIPTSRGQGTAGGAYMMNLATQDHARGNWQDWVVGATFMLAGGRVAKSGSHAVKSVAGYDVHRFMAGTRGSLAICLELILRAYPISLLPTQSEAPPLIDSPRTPCNIVPAQEHFMRRAKAIFDPTHKLNPGEWGFL